MVGFFHGGIEHADGGAPDIAACAVALDVGNDGVVRNGEDAVVDGDLVTYGWCDVLVRHKLVAIAEIRLTGRRGYDKQGKCEIAHEEGFFALVVNVVSAL